VAHHPVGRELRVQRVDVGDVEADPVEPEVGRAVGGAGRRRHLPLEQVDREPGPEAPLVVEDPRVPLAALEPERRPVLG